MDRHDLRLGMTTSVAFPQIVFSYLGGLAGFLIKLDGALLDAEDVFT